MKLLIQTGILVTAWATTVVGQEARRRSRVVSPEVTADRQITVRLRAAKAETVSLTGGDLPEVGRGRAMTKGEGDVWSTTLDAVEPGTYRYKFNVDGVEVADPANPATSESNDTVWSVVHVPGSDTADAREVAHGSLAEVTYHSKSLGRARRMHVYTPPGYELGSGKFPVLYLLHGASDSDDSWSSVGRAGFILDNLIAAGKAKPMIVVMPAGHTGPFSFGGGGSLNRQVNAFVDDFEQDIRPHVEKTYRVVAERSHRAVAGLSMGGAQTLRLVIPHLDQYGSFGVFSAGVFGIADADSTWEKDNEAALDNAAWKDGLKLAWFATGKDDFLVRTSRTTVEILKKHGFNVTYHETSGGHTWLNWRAYLSDFLPLLFRD